MKQTLDLLLSTLKKLEKTSKTDDITKLEEEVVLLIKDLTSSIAENKYSKDDGDLKSRVGELGEVIENLNKKAIYLYIREMTDCKTQNITKVVNKMRDVQTSITRSYIENGYIDNN